MYYAQKQWSFLVGFLLFTALACIKESPLPPTSVFDKAKREQLGDLIQDHIYSEVSSFQVLPNEAPYDTIYGYIQRLYNQATNAIRIDHRSSKTNRWNLDRQWNVIIIDNELDRIAFALPGGHICISTAFLKTIEREYELYYILAFEAAMIDERNILNGLISEFNSRVLLNFAEMQHSPTDEPTKELAQSFLDLEYDDLIISQNDKATAQLICETSLYDRFGIIPVLNRLNDSDQWISTRPNYLGRSNMANLLLYEVEGRCGELKTNGGYRKYVRDKLN